MKSTKRSYQKELLDLGDSHYTQQEYDDCLLQLARIGHFLGGNKASLKTFHQLPKFQTVLDVGCGGGQFALQLAQTFPQSQILGIDISAKAIAFANKQLESKPLHNVTFLISPDEQLNFPANSFDVITSTLVCHHLNDNQLIEFLKKSYQIAKKSIVINDLHRHWIAYSSFGMIAGIFFRNRLIYHDGILSIKRAFKREDWINYLNAAQIPLEHCSINWHWAFRWIVHIDTSFKMKA